MKREIWVTHEFTRGSSNVFLPRIDRMSTGLRSVPFLSNFLIPFTRFLRVGLTPDIIICNRRNFARSLYSFFIISQGKFRDSCIFVRIIIFELISNTCSHPQFSHRRFGGN